MTPNRPHRITKITTAAVTLALMAGTSACGSGSGPTAAAQTTTTRVATGPTTTGPTTTEPATTELPAMPSPTITSSDLAAALDVDPVQYGPGFFAPPADAPALAAKLTQSQVTTAANTPSCADLKLLTATPDFSQVYATPASDVVTVHAYLVDPSVDPETAFTEIAGNVDRVSTCLLAVGSAGLDVFFGEPGNTSGITGGTQRLVSSVAPPAQLTSGGAIAFDTKTDLKGAALITINGKFIVFRVGTVIVTIEGSSLADASGIADHGATLVAEHLATRFPAG